MNVVIAIPARMASTRFPGKPLCDLLGKPMIQWVVEAAREAGVAEHIVIGTPDEEIVRACRGFGAECLITRADHVSGTDRLAEMAEAIEGEVWLNVQGDEPLIKPSTIRACLQPLLEDPAVDMASVWCPCPESDVDNPAAVKVVMDLAGNALYFSRYSIPFDRQSAIGNRQSYKRHVGIYAYRRQILKKFAGWAPTPLERSEGLEQLRFLESGVKIRMSAVDSLEIGVDTPEQAEQVRRVLEARR